jgi:hypothetical protein
VREDEYEDSAYFSTLLGPDPGPSLEVGFKSLSISTDLFPENQTQYFLHFTRIQIVASQPPTSNSTSSPDLLDWSPKTTPSGGDTVKMTGTNAKTQSATISVSQKPSLSLSGARIATSGTEEVKYVSTIVAKPVIEKTSYCSGIGWVYSIDDAQHKEHGLHIEDRPRVEFSVDSWQRLQVEVEVWNYWSTPMCSGLPRPRIWTKDFFKKVARSTPVFANLLQRVATSIPLDGLKGLYRVSGAKLNATTEIPELDANGGLQCHDSVGCKLVGNHPDSKVTLRCSLYGKVGSVKQLSGTATRARHFGGLVY